MLLISRSCGLVVGVKVWFHIINDNRIIIIFLHGFVAKKLGEIKIKRWHSTTRNGFHQQITKTNAKKPFFLLSLNGN